MAAVKTGTSGCACAKAVSPSGQLTTQIMVMRSAPASFELAQALAGAAAGGEHGIEQEHVRTGEVRGQIGIVGLRQGGFLIPFDAHMRDACVWHQWQNAIQQSQSGAQDGHEDHGPRQP
jgi:hypothetical protein